ncbi:hypothetical protein [Lentibacillus sp. CBA3610]|uniref:hypothetical protein n=1 Tax=Lentibacillus sp. CBA3610 TaxID=2518176 RepID=UPI0015957AF2|nr:hypothetical protein [Lentibacillus sp. CBA3610]
MFVKVLLFPLQSGMARVTTIAENAEIQDIDGNIINMLLMIYILAVKEPGKNEGGVEGVNQREQ